MAPTAMILVERGRENTLLGSPRCRMKGMQQCELQCSECLLPAQGTPLGACELHSWLAVVCGPRWGRQPKNALYARPSSLAHVLLGANHGLAGETADGRVRERSGPQGAVSVCTPSGRSGYHVTGAACFSRLPIRWLCSNPPTLPCGARSTRRSRWQPPTRLSC